MLRFSLISLMVAIISAVFSFGAVGASAIAMAKLMVFVSLVLFVISMFTGYVSSRQHHLNITKLNAEIPTTK